MILFLIKYWSQILLMMLKEAIKILTDSNNTTKIITRETKVFSQLLHLLDNPQQSFKSLHITGTNGKGSVTLKTAYILEKAGYKTGIYTSPHIFSFLERIKINRDNISEKYFSQSILKIHEIANKHRLQLTFFQYLTATGFLYFKDERCDFASIQVGMGGRYDTTNVISPQVSIITSIGIDHQKILGTTRQQISKDKAGIIKQGVPVVVGPHAYLNPIIQEAKMKQAELLKVENNGFKDFDEENNAITEAAINALIKRNNIKIDKRHIEEGLLIQQPCRMEELSLNLKPSWAKQKRIFFDVGHNPNAIERMLQYYKSKIKKEGQKLIVLFGSSKQKNVFFSLKVLEQVADIIFFIEAKHPRAMSVNQMSEYVGYSKYPHKFRILDDGKISTTLTLATGQRNHQNIIICGSFFLMRESWAFFDKQYLEDQTDIQQQYKMKNQDNPKNL